jgi:hypothetical protein
VLTGRISDGSFGGPIFTLWTTTELFVRPEAGSDTLDDRQ